MLDFKGKVILAPMVRTGTLPMRLLALEFGADIVYTEEIIDFRLLKCQRTENKILETVDYFDEDHNIVFRTCTREKPHLVLQLGTCCPERALKAAQMVEKDVSGIDINMGCPKEFSLKGGMGAALLSQPEKIKGILLNLTLNLSCPVTCKIRVLPSLEDTVALVKVIESTGVAAIAIHGRTVSERPRHKNRNHYIRAIAAAVSIPVIANGGSSDIVNYKTIEEFREETKCSSVMIARAAQTNCSVFLKSGARLPLTDVVDMYIKYAVSYDSTAPNTKYCVQQMIGSLQSCPQGRELLSAQSLRAICAAFDLTDYYDTCLQERESKIENLKRAHDSETELQMSLKKRKIEDDTVHELDIKFIRSNYGTDDLPKSVLWMYAKYKQIPEPKYKTTQYEKSFQSIVTVDETKYTNCCLEKNKKNAEQAAALAAGVSLGLIELPSPPSSLHKSNGSANSSSLKTVLISQAST